MYYYLGRKRSKRDCGLPEAQRKKCLACVTSSSVNAAERIDKVRALTHGP